MIKIISAQLNFTVGDICGNTQKIINSILSAKNDHHADLIVFSELAICGYPPEDLLNRNDFFSQIDKNLLKIISLSQDIDILLGVPEKTSNEKFNSAIWIRNGKIIASYKKQVLPNYSVFDEQRYFEKGSSQTIVELKNIRFSILICEDIWHSKIVMDAKLANANCIICLNASPYSMRKSEIRMQILSQRNAETNLPIIMVNQVGGQDDLVFDGDSIVLNKKGEIVDHANYFEEQLLPIALDNTGNPIKSLDTFKKPKCEEHIELVYKALVTGTRDYITKNNFKGAIIGLSGGIDSALTLAIASDAIGPEKITTIFMPSKYSSTLSKDLAIEQTNILSVNYKSIPIDNIFDNYVSSLKPLFFNTQETITEQNIQARIRGNILMALSNQTGDIVLTTGNKSEMAVGYATIYGDMAGGFCVLKDVYKTLVYKLALYRNSISYVIPNDVITRKPTAELAPHQTDQDTLPPYDLLDNILAAFIDNDKSIDEITNSGIDKNIIKNIVKMVLKNEYKRRQSPPGPRITEKAFGKDRRYPVTSAFSPV
jgi:NAD+ synthase (glutamine-hydrolysing)